MAWSSSARTVALTFAAAAMLFCGCSGGEGDGGMGGTRGTAGTGGTPDGRVLETGLFGTVVDASGQPIQGVTVTVSGISATTDADGEFVIETGVIGSTVARFRAEGYLPTVRKLAIAGESPTAAHVTLKPRGLATSMSADTGGTAMGDREASVTIEPGDLSGPNGSSVTGMVDVSITPVDPSLQDEVQALTGSFDDGTNLLESFGMVFITIRQGNVELQVAVGQTLVVVIPLPSGTALEDLPATMPLWSLNENTGQWEEEGTLTLDEESNAFVGEVNRMASWNADIPAASTCITGLAVDDEEGEPIAGAEVDTTGVDYSGSSTGSTGDEGRFYIPVRKSSQVLVSVSHAAEGGASREVMSGVDDTTIPPMAGDSRCTDIGTFTVTRAQPPAPSCEGVSCTSSNQCVQDGMCNDQTGTCIPGDDEPLGTPCGDGLFCDGESNCIGCIDPSECDDDNVCTVDDCVARQCSYVPDVDAECELGPGLPGICDNRGECVELPPARVRVAHLAPEIPTAQNTAVDIYIDGALTSAQGLTFGSSTGFEELPPGEYLLGIAPAGSQPTFAFTLSLTSGQISTVVVIRTAANRGLPLDVLVLDGSLDGLQEGNGRVVLGHGADDTSLAVIDGINTSTCPPAVLGFEDVIFGTARGPGDFVVGVEPAAIAAPDSCVPLAGPFATPTYPGIAVLSVAVDLDTVDGSLDVAGFAMIGDAAGPIPRVPELGDLPKPGGCDVGLCVLDAELKTLCDASLNGCLDSVDPSRTDECFLGAPVVCNTAQASCEPPVDVSGMWEHDILCETTCDDGSTATLNKTEDFELIQTGTSVTRIAPRRSCCVNPFDWYSVGEVCGSQLIVQQEMPLGLEGSYFEQEVVFTFDEGGDGFESDLEYRHQRGSQLATCTGVCQSQGRRFDGSGGTGGAQLMEFAFEGFFDSDPAGILGGDLAYSGSVVYDPNADWILRETTSDYEKRTWDVVSFTVVVAGQGLELDPRVPREGIGILDSVTTVSDSITFSSEITWDVSVAGIAVDWGHVRAGSFGIGVTFTDWLLDVPSLYADQLINDDFSFSFTSTDGVRYDLQDADEAGTNGTIVSFGLFMP